MDSVKNYADMDQELQVIFYPSFVIPSIVLSHLNFSYTLLESMCKHGSSHLVHQRLYCLLALAFLIRKWKQMGISQPEPMFRSNCLVHMFYSSHLLAFDVNHILKRLRHLKLVCTTSPSKLNLQGIERWLQPTPGCKDSEQKNLFTVLIIITFLFHFTGRIWIFHFTK